MKNHTKTFSFMAFLTKLWLVLKPLHIRFDKTDGFIRVYYGTKNLVLFGAEKYDFTTGSDNLKELEAASHLLFS